MEKKDGLLENIVSEYIMMEWVCENKMEKTWLIICIGITAINVVIKQVF